MGAYSRTEEHLGEWKVTLGADTLEELFAEGARFIARAAGPVRAPRPEEPSEWQPVTVTGTSRETLLVDWLNELLGRSEIEERAFAEVRNLRLEEARVEAEVRGRPVRAWRSPLKAATYHGAEVKREGGRWKARVLFDV